MIWIHRHPALRQIPFLNCGKLKWQMFSWAYFQKKKKCVCVRERQKNGGPQHSHSNLNHRRISWDFLTVENFSGQWSLINAKKVSREYIKKKEKDGKRCCIMVSFDSAHVSYMSNVNKFHSSGMLKRFGGWNLIKILHLDLGTFNLTIIIFCDIEPYSFYLQ